MLVSLDEGNTNVINVLDPVNPQDAATKNYVDTKSLSVTGTNKMLNSLNAGNFNVINVLDPVNPQDVVTKNYVDSTENTFVLLPYFPVLTSNSGNTGGWLASASSEFNSTYAAYQVTTNNDWLLKLY